MIILKESDSYFISMKFKRDFRSNFPILGFVLRSRLKCLEDDHLSALHIGKAIELHHSQKISW